jgi:hypothetical protein
MSTWPDVWRARPRRLCTLHMHCACTAWRCCTQVASVHPGLGTAGSFNVSLQYEAGFRGARPLVHNMAYMYDRAGKPYMYQTYPVVLGVSPSNGSTAGGTLVTISGRGFPSLDLGLGDTLAVRLYGVPCAVQSSNYTTIVCRSGPAPSSAPPAFAAALRGQFPGMRGAEHEYYTGAGVPSLWQLNSTILVSAARPGSYKTVLMDAAEARDLHISPAFACVRTKFMFVAPEAGNYTFMMTVDDYAQLNGTWLQVRRAPGRRSFQADAVCARVLPCHCTVHDVLSSSWVSSLLLAGAHQSPVPAYLVAQP